MKPIVAIVGRPNVGKSTLFNRITRTRNALVDDWPGVTRDRHYGDAVWDEREFTLVDTGGFAEPEVDAFAEQVRYQVGQAIDDADAVLLLLDGKSGLTPYDRELVEILRGGRRPVFHAVNKIDGGDQEAALYEFYNLGVEPLYPISAEHRYGLGSLLDELVGVLPEAPPEAEPDRVRVAVVGRPNVGKSSLINRILGEPRLVVSDVPGTTRDAVDSAVSFGGRDYLFIDTAGIRRKGRVSRKLEKFSIIKALRSLDRCDVALVVLDASEGITDQDITVAGYAHDRGCGAVFVLNKWDLVEKDTGTAKLFVERLRQAAKFLAFAPAITISALTGQRVTRIFSRVEAVHEQYVRRVGTGPVNRIVEQAVTRTPPALHRGKRLKFYYTTQIATGPPTFVSFVSYPEAVHFSYKRYLVNRIRQETGLDRTPLRLEFRPRSGRMDFSTRKRRPGLNRGHRVKRSRRTGKRK